MIFYTFQGVSAVNAWQPFVTLNIYDDGRLTIARRIGHIINFCHHARHRCVYRRRDKASCLCQHCSHHYLVAFFHYGHRWRSDMLRQREHGLLRQCRLLCGHVCRQLFIGGMNTSYFKRS